MLNEGDLWRLSQNFIPEEKKRITVFNAGIQDIKDGTFDYGIAIEGKELIEGREELVFKALVPHLPLTCLIKTYLAELWDIHSEKIMMAGAAVFFSLLIVWRIQGKGLQLHSLFW